MNMVYGLIGAGGYGRETIFIMRQMLQDKITAGIAKIFFVVEGECSAVEINGYPVISLEAFCNIKNPKHFNIAIGDSAVRKRIADICFAAGAVPFSIMANNLCLMEPIDLGEGTILSPFVTITANVRIGCFFHANIYSYVAHDCIVGDFVTFGPSVNCNGRVLIEDHAYIGSGACIKEGKQGSPLIIGRGAVVGMGAVVTKNVPPGTTVVGNPARPLIKSGLGK
ncbi:MAG: acetyltransferase [Legionella sp.]|nr:acetyltransferase [Legionella sp.]